MRSAPGGQRRGLGTAVARGWRTLRVLADTDNRLDPGQLAELMSRARRQADLLEELRVQAAGQVISS